MIPYLRQLAKKLTADKKKLSIMVSLAAVMLLLWGRLLLKEIPRTAVANPTLSPVADTFDPQAMAESKMMLAKVEVDLPQTLSRDLFTLNLAGYVSTQARPIVQVTAEKSDTKPSDEKLKAQQVHQAANGLKLQTTINAKEPLALINGHLLREGDSIDGFVLIKILHRHVILKMNGIEINLEM
jgi:hypothetical protein